MTYPRLMEHGCEHLGNHYVVLFTREGVGTVVSAHKRAKVKVGDMSSDFNMEAFVPSTRVIFLGNRRLQNARV